MPKLVRAALAAGLLALSLPPLAARADTPGPDWIPRERVAEILKQAGYGPIVSMEADDGHWEGKTTKDGQTIEFHVDPRTGAITKAQPGK